MLDTSALTSQRSAITSIHASRPTAGNVMSVTRESCALGVTRPSWDVLAAAIHVRVKERTHHRLVIAREDLTPAPRREHDGARRDPLVRLDDDLHLAVFVARVRREERRELREVVSADRVVIDHDPAMLEVVHDPLV